MRPALTLVLVLAALVAGCGSTTGQDRPGAEATLLLDFTPNAVHAGLYLADGARSTTRPRASS